MEKMSSYFASIFIEPVIQMEFFWIHWIDHKLIGINFNWLRI